MNAWWRSRCQLVALMGCSLLVLLPGAAHARWSPTRALAEHVRTYQVAVNTRGDVVAAWTEGRHDSALYVAVGDVRRGLRRKRRVGPATSYLWTRPRVAIGPDGVGLVAWDDSADGASQYDTSAGRLVVVRPDGEIGQVQPIGARAAVGVDGTGRVVAMWASRRSEYAYPDLYVAEAGAPGAPFGRPTVLTERFNLHSPLHLSVNARGDAVAMWTVWNGSGSHVEATARKAGEAFAPPRRACPAAAHRCEGLRLELAPNGSVTGTWSEGTRASRRVAEGLIGRPLRLGAIPAPRSYGLRAPVETLDVANDGSAVVAWAARQGVAAAARAGRRWRSLGAIARGSAYEPAAAALGHGRSVVVWREQQRDKWLVVARAIGRSGHAGRRHVLSRISDLYRGGVPRPSTTFVPPVVGADARGRAVALWKRYDGRLEMAVKR